MAGMASPPFDRAALARFLAEASGAGTVEVGEPSLLPGGAIQENWGFDAEFAGGRLDGMQRLVLRTDAPTGIASSLGRSVPFGRTELQGCKFCTVLPQGFPQPGAAPLRSRRRNGASGERE